MKRLTTEAILVLPLILVSGMFLCAQAATITFTSPVGLLLTSPTTTLTIVTGSVADLVTVNATSVALTLSSTTGGGFSLLSPSYDLSVATSSGGGSVTISCSGGIETATLSQSTGSTVYTVTPSTTNCAKASPPVITSITAGSITTNGAVITWTTNISADSTVSYGPTISYGATSTDPTLVTAHSISFSNLNANTLYHFAVTSSENGTSTISGDNMFTTPAVATTSSPTISVSVGVPNAYGSPFGSGGGSASTGGVLTTSSTAELQAELNALLAELATLEAEANGSVSFPAASVPISFSYTFTRDLHQGMTGSDVTELQKFLILENEGPAARALKAHGTTKNFATLTFAALKEFQSAVGIHPASGYFGPITRAYVTAAEE